MDNLKMLSGEQLVSKGVTKIDATLPEIGMKDILPNGSWLEQKQVQSALEARKHLIEVERIEKCGALSHAEWRDDLKLAEVTQQTGGYWQYFGCHIGKKLYLKPEEALFLMEVNSLQLKHNEVTVSLQKAYSLLLSGTVSFLQYKVYASLSRLGYKVYTHKELEIDKIKKETVHQLPEQRDYITDKVAENIDDSKGENKLNKDDEIKLDVHTFHPNNLERNELKFEDETSMTNCINSDIEIVKEDPLPTKIISVDVEESKLDDVDKNFNHEDVKNNMHLCSSPRKTENEPEFSETHKKDNTNINKINDISTLDVATMNVDSEVPCNMSPQKYDNDIEIMEITQDSESIMDTKQNYNLEQDITNNEIILQKLLNRKTKPSNTQNIHKYFSDIPDLFQKQIVTINVPKEEYIPKNIFVNNTAYVLNLERIQIKNIRAISNETTYNASDEVNESLRRIRNSSRNDTPQFNSDHLFFANMRCPRMNQQFRPFNFWRPRSHLNYFQFNMFYQRPFLQNCFMPRFNFSHRMNNFLRQLPNSGYVNTNNLSIGSSRKRTRDEKLYHLEHIKVLASRFKQTIIMGNRNAFNIQSLQRLIFSYNAKFRCRLRLTDDFEIVDDSTIIETIELEDEEESKKKKPKLETDTFKDNINKIRILALRLRNIEEKEIASSRLRRALSNVIKTFNKSYNADVYLNANYEVIDRRHITLDSSSDSDCVVKENEERKTKKLRNPFSMLKTLTKTINTEQPSTSTSAKDNAVFQSQNQSIIEQKKNNDQLKNIFSKNWLPNSDLFGRTEVVTKQYMNTCIMDTYKEELLYDFIQNNPKRYGSWLASKIAFAKYIVSTNRQFQNNHGSIENLIIGNEGGLGSIITSDDCTDMASILNKLRIISTDTERCSETRLNIDFDVYNRDVQNFRKSIRQKPHFRVICIDESSKFPSGDDFLGIQSKNKDGVATVFAVVGIGSISYLQINPTDLPVYIPCNDLT